RPVDVPVQAVLVEDRCGALLQAFHRGLGGETEVEYRLQRAGDDVGGASAGVEVGNLEAGRREEGVAVVPVLGGQFGQRRRRQVNRILRQVRIGHVALMAAYCEGATERATTAVLHHVAHQRRARRLADDAPVQPL